MTHPLPTEEAFVRATLAVYSDGLALDVTRVLNRLCPDACGVSPARVIAEVDSIMEELYRRRVLTCPGHRWLFEHVPSIAGHLTGLFSQGYITWSEAGWAFTTVTSIYALHLKA